MVQDTTTMLQSGAKAEIIQERTPQAVKNTLLTTLSPRDFAELMPLLQPVSLKRNEVLHDAQRRADAAYFIESGVVSRVARTSKDGPVEVAVVGRYGFVGISVVLGTMRSTQRSIVLVPGNAYRIEAEALQRVLREQPAVRDHLLKYVHSLIALEAQIALCNAKHDVDERVARWLLLAQDRIGGDLVPVTHGVIASALGVRRPSVSKTVADLELKGIVEGSRGSVRILDVESLRRIACECHKIVEDQFRLFRQMPQNNYVW
jgi:CRP-like cAMP-binding protein